MADRIAILNTGRVAQIGTPEEIYNHPNSPFVAGFMGAGNVLPLRMRSDGKLAGDGIVLDAAQLTPDGGRPWPNATAVIVHFRSEEARFCSLDRPNDDCLVLQGEVVRCSYPGGFYRYTVRIGTRQYLVDDLRKLAIGETIGIALPVTALHVYPPA